MLASGDWGTTLEYSKDMNPLRWAMIRHMFSIYKKSYAKYFTKKGELEVKRPFFAVLGGMGTLATESYIRLVNAATHAHSDQGYLDYVVFNDASVPDRTAVHRRRVG